MSCFSLRLGKVTVSHVFSATLDQHNAAVVKYRASQRKAAVAAKQEQGRTKEG